MTCDTDIEITPIEITSTLNTTGVPLVLFSGGLDSTYLLQTLLQEYKEVDVLCVELKSQPNQTARQNKAIDKILKRLANLQVKEPDRYGVIRHKHTFSNEGLCFGGLSLNQMHIWITSAMCAVRRDTQGLYIGYVSGDDAIYSISSLQHAWANLIQACEFLGNTPPQLYTPLGLTKKASILANIDPTLLKHVTWCESVDSKSDLCGVCPSCERAIVDFQGLVTLGRPCADSKYVSSRLAKMLTNRQKKLSKEENRRCLIKV